MTDVISFFRVAVLSVFVGMLASACDDNPGFRISGTVDGLGTRHISLIYAADGELHTVTTTAIDGKFSFEGMSRDYTIAELAGPQGRIFSHILVRNGDNIKCNLDIDDPYKLELSGTSAVKQWSRFLTGNREVLTDGTPEMVNDLVEKYVADNPGNVLSSLMLLTLYDARDNESKASKLFASLSPDARPDKLVMSYRLLLSQQNNATINTKVKTLTFKNDKDSVMRFVPLRSSYSLLCFAPDAKITPDTMKRTIFPAFERYPRKRLRVVEISCAQDSAQWRHSVDRDSVDWIRTWIPAGPASPMLYDLSIPSLPYYILADSTGNQVYRGTSAKAAVDSLTRRLSHPKK